MRIHRWVGQAGESKQAESDSGNSSWQLKHGNTSLASNLSRGSVKPARPPQLSATYSFPFEYPGQQTNTLQRRKPKQIPSVEAGSTRRQVVVGVTSGPASRGRVLHLCAHSRHVIGKSLHADPKARSVQAVLSQYRSSAGRAASGPQPSRARQREPKAPRDRRDAVLSQATCRGGAA